MHFLAVIAILCEHYSELLYMLFVKIYNMFMSAGFQFLCSTHVVSQHLLSFISMSNMSHSLIDPKFSFYFYKERMSGTRPICLIMELFTKVLDQEQISRRQEEHLQKVANVWTHKMFTGGAKCFGKLKHLFVEK